MGDKAKYYDAHYDCVIQKRLGRPEESRACLSLTRQQVAAWMAVARAASDASLPGARNEDHMVETTADLIMETMLCIFEEM